MLEHKNAIALSLCRPTSQRLMLIALVVLTYWNGLWGGSPRADQITYLNQISQFSSFWDILINSPSWNRTQSAGDFMLFRPILFLQLGFFYHFFGYNFFLWQLASLALHIFVVIGLHSLLLHGSLKNTLYPLLIASFFGCSFLSSELVLWHHMSGYLTFSMLAIYTVLFLVKFIATGKKHFGWITLSLGVLAEFTYELGVVLILLIATIFFYILLTKAKPPKTQSKVYLNWGFLFLCGAILYPVLSVADLLARDVSISSGGINSPSLNGFMLATWYAVIQIIFWVGGWVLPSAYDIHATPRAFFSGFRFSGALFIANCTAAIGVTFVVILGLKKEFWGSLAKNRKGWLSVTCVLTFLFVYSFIIAYGRALPRGLNYVLEINTYYAYIACLAIAVALSLFHIEANDISTSSAVAADDKPLTKNSLTQFNSALLAALIFTLVAFNSYCTFKLASAYRFNYSPTRLEVIDAMKYWLKHAGKSEYAYFKVSDSCSGNEKLTWLKSSSWSVSVTMADVLWPEKSFRLNEGNLAGKKYDVFDVKCTEISASSKLNKLGVQGLLSASNPGWHAALPVSYPQILDIDFSHARSVKRLLFLHQEGFSTRAPKAVRIEGSDDNSMWQEAYNGELDCSRNFDQWKSVAFPKPVEHRYLKIYILSNCGDPTYLTLRGLRFD